MSNWKCFFGGHKWETIWSFVTKDTKRGIITTTRGQKCSTCEKERKKEERRFEQSGQP